MQSEQLNMSELIWNTQIPIKFKLNYIEEANIIESPCLYLMVNRIHYISLYYEKIHNHFKNFISDIYILNDIWLEWRNILVNWDIPFGVFFDIYGNNEENLPIEIIVNYRFFPKDNVLFTRNKEIGEKSYFFWDLKQASCIKFENNAYQIISKMPSEQGDQLWENFIQANYIDFFKIFNNIWDIKLNENKKMNYKALPLRIYINDSIQRIQRVFRVSKSNENSTLEDLLKEFFPKIMENNKIMEENKKIIIKSHGIDLSLNTKICFLYENFFYLDGFIYLIIKLL